MPWVRAVTRGTGATSWVLMGSLVSGIGAYLFQILGTRSLGEEAYAPISVLWTLQYLILSIALISVEANLTRAVTLAEGARGALRRHTRAVTAWILSTAALVGAVSYGYRASLFGGLGEMAAVAALIVISYGIFVTLRGWLAGVGRFRSYGIVTAGESIARLLATIVVVAVAATPTSIAWVMPLGPLVVFAWWVRERRKPVVEEPGPAPPPPAETSTKRFLAATTLANASSQILLAAGPLLLIPLGASAAEVSVFFVTVTAARVPLAFALGGVLSRVLPPLTRMARRGEWAPLRRIALGLGAGTLVLAAVGAAVTWWVGPAVIALFFGSTFRPQGWFVAAAAATVLLACGALLLNQLLIGMQAESRLVVPWLASLGLGVGLVGILPGTPTFRVAIAFMTGELVALFALVVALMVTTRRRAEIVAATPPDPEDHWP